MNFDFAWVLENSFQWVKFLIQESERKAFFLRSPFSHPKSFHKSRGVFLSFISEVVSTIVTESIVGIANGKTKTHERGLKIEAPW